MLRVCSLCVSVPLLLCSPAFGVSKPSIDTHPNILFIAVDDLRPELGCYGVEEILSPHIDRLAASGVTFTRAYCQQAVCNPSRASLMTGLRPDSTGVWDLITHFRDKVPDVVTLPQHFRQQGYRALAFGKIYHNSLPDRQSWDEPNHWPKKATTWSVASRKRLAAYRKQMREAGKSDAAIARMRAPATDDEDVPDNQRPDGEIADQALAAMDELAAQKQPFFLAVGFIRPHLPFTPPKKYWDLYRRDEISLASNPQLPTDAPPLAMNTMYELRDYMDFAGTPAPDQGSLTEEQQRRLKHGYYASVSSVDAQVGRLLDRLESLRLADNTIVVLWGDHGWKLGEHNSWCKQTDYEIDTRAPLIIRAPNSPIRGGQSEQLVEFVDIYPSLCELADLPTPEHLEGKSFAPLLDEPDQPWKKSVFSQFRRRQGKRELMGYAMRTDRYRYVEWLDRHTVKTTATELYDHKRDPDENANIAAQSEFTEIVEGLHKQLWAALPKPAPLPRKKTTPRPKLVLQNELKERVTGPNILFLMGDDWSWPHASALGDEVVKTPTFDRIAAEGVLFDHAFVSAPSCTPSRMAVATGQWHWRLGEAANLGGSLAESVPVYPELLETAGYRIGFARKGAAPSKHTYRKRDPFGSRFDSFEAFLKDRADGEAFCFWYGSGEPHRPYRWQSGLEAGMDVDKIVVPECLPNHDTVRTDLADYYHDVQRFDTDAARMLARLEELGILDNTIVVMSGDNGMPFPRCKATLYDTGTRVPLAIRWPERVPPGRRVSDFVSLCDLAPTFLDAAEVAIPKVMTGRSLLPILACDKAGRVDSSRSFILTGMEKHVFATPARAIRTDEFLYIRNFDPTNWPTGRGKGPPPQYDFSKKFWPSGAEAFSFNVDPSPTKQFLLDQEDDTSNQPFHNLAFGQRPDEELYDLQADPGQVTNVAGDAKYATVRTELSQQLEKELRASGDTRLAVTADPTCPNILFIAVDDIETDRHEWRNLTGDSEHADRLATMRAMAPKNMVPLAETPARVK